MKHLAFKRVIELRKHSRFEASACGRHGSFDPRSIRIVNWNSEGYESVKIDVSSVRLWTDVPPLHLRLPFDEARQLASSILEITGEGG